MGTEAPPIDSTNADGTVKDDEVDELDAVLEGIEKDDGEPKKDEDEPKPDDKKDEPKPDDDKPGKDEKDEKDEPAKDADKKDEPAVEDPLVIENRNLKTMLREQKRDQALTKQRLARLDSRVAPETDDDGKIIEPKLSNIEELQMAIGAIGEQKGALFDVLIDTMELNPKFADIQKVCTQDRLEDILEVAAKSVADSKGGDPLEIQLAMELDVWSKSNPYKYMYGLIKAHHPDFTAPSDAKAALEGKDKVEGDKGEHGKKAAAAPGTIADKGASSAKDTAGWTAAKIAALPEDELDKVPKDVYDKYMEDKLD